MHREKQLNKHILANRTAGMELVLIGSLPYQQKSLRYVVRCFKKKKAQYKFNKKKLFH